MPTDPQPPSTYDRIYAVARRIPRGKVCTYGRVAELAGLGRAARQVGYAMAALPDHTTVPWHRVINAQGRVSLRRGGSGELEQRFRLEAEGVVFDAGGRVSLERFGWTGGRKRKKADDGED
ncbi:MAG TPA: MGMT family protein [Longimicrobium sp.]|nr:MGMT family protein [Longimicrobium sp.]